MKIKNCKILSKKDSKDNSNSRLYMVPLKQTKTGYLLFFLAPGFVLSTSMLNIIVLILTFFYEEDKNLVWNAIWNNTKRGSCSFLITILLGIGIVVLCLVIKEIFKTRINVNYLIGRIRKYLRKRLVFPAIYLIIFLIYLVMIAPINSILLLSGNDLNVYKANPFLLIPVCTTFLVFCFHLLFNPPHKTIGDLLDAGMEICSILSESPKQTIENKLTMDYNTKNETTSETWEKVGYFFYLLSKFLEEHITISIKDSYELTANIMMTWVSEQKTNLTYLIDRINEILECINIKNMTKLISNLQKIAEKAKSSSKKYEIILDFMPYSDDEILEKRKGIPRIQLLYYFIGMLGIIYSIVMSL